MDRRLLSILFIISVLALIPSSPIWARPENDTVYSAKLETDSVYRPKHEVMLGIGYPGLYPLLSAIYDGGRMGMNMLPTFYFQYLYNLNKCIGIGATASYSYSHWYRYRYNWASIDVSARFYWFHRKYVSMYSKVSAGLAVECRSDVLSDPKVVALFDGHLSPAGLEVGGSHWRGFVELGFGTSYICSGGVKYRF